MVGLPIPFQGFTFCILASAGKETLYTTNTKEEIEMTTTETWWETIFEGHLSLGINKERLTEMDEESFLYFDSEEQLQEQIH